MYIVYIYILIMEYVTQGMFIVYIYLSNMTNKLSYLSLNNSLIEVNLYIGEFINPTFLKSHEFLIFVTIFIQPTIFVKIIIKILMFNFVKFSKISKYKYIRHKLVNIGYSLHLQVHTTRLFTHLPQALPKQNNEMKFAIYIRESQTENHAMLTKPHYLFRLICAE